VVSPGKSLNGINIDGTQAEVGDFIPSSKKTAVPVLNFGPNLISLPVVRFHLSELQKRICPSCVAFLNARGDVISRAGKGIMTAAGRWLPYGQRFC
jgi:hypothetical protein